MRMCVCVYFTRIQVFKLFILSSLINCTPALQAAAGYSAIRKHTGKVKVNAAPAAAAGKVTYNLKVKRWQGIVHTLHFQLIDS